MFRRVYPDNDETLKGAIVGVLTDESKSPVEVWQEISIGHGYARASVRRALREMEAAGDILQMGNRYRHFEG